MRTKTLLLTAALGLAGAATTMAQVYSVNAVGYVNVDLLGGGTAGKFQMVANPLNNQLNNQIGTLMPSAPDGTMVYKFKAPDYQILTYDEALGGWDDPTVALDPGEGAFIFLSATAPAKTTLTFVGEVMQGHLETAVPKGFAILSSKVPQEGLLQTNLGFPAPQGGDTIYTFDPATQGYTIYTYDADLGGWDPNEPTVKVAQAFWSYKPESSTAATWVRDFNVNQ